MSHQSSAERVIEDLRVEIFRQRLTQGRIAASTGYSQSTISRRLSGEVSPTLDELEKIAAAAGREIVVELRPAVAGASDVVGVELQTLPTAPEGPVADTAGSSTPAERAS